MVEGHCFAGGIGIVNRRVYIYIFFLLLCREL